MPEAVTDSQRVKALTSALCMAETTLWLSPGIDMPLAVRVDRILRIAHARRLEPRLYRLAWLIRKQCARFGRMTNG
jgi:hypothetical protein